MGAQFDSHVVGLCISFLCTILCAEISGSIAGAPLVCLEAERKALLKFRDGLNDPEHRLSSWQGGDCCSWRGVVCDNQTGNVVGINLRNPYPFNPLSKIANRYGFWNLSGQIDSSLRELKALKYLDLSLNTFNGISIPDFFGSLKELRYLNLSKNEFSGIVPGELGNLSSLQYLDLSGNFLLSSNSIQWVSGLASLRALDMDSVDLSMVNDNWVEAVNHLPLLEDLRLTNCFLSSMTSSLPNVNFTSLRVLHLNGSSFNSTIPDWVVNVTGLVSLDLSQSDLYGSIPVELGEFPYLEELNLGFNENLTANISELLGGSWKKIKSIILKENKLHGEIPTNIGNMSLLEELDLASNNIQGTLPGTIGKPCSTSNSDCFADTALSNLKVFDMNTNRLSGELPGWLGGLKSLVHLHLGNNNLRGSIPSSVWSLRNLQSINLSGNQLNGSISQSLGQLSGLQDLDLSLNNLGGSLTEAHFLHLQKLKILNLLSNSFVFGVNPSWVPPFQVTSLFLGSCHLGPRFPLWLQNQKAVSYLDLSNASISDTIPEWFWDISSNLSLLNLSYNHIQGQLPNPFRVGAFADVDLRSNQLQGQLPLPFYPLSLLDLSNNQFTGPLHPNISSVMPDITILAISSNHLTGSIPFSIGEMLSLQVLDLSRNGFTEGIPSSLGNCSYLKALDLSSNYLAGWVPESIGHLQQLKSLHLNNNSLSGKFPASLKNCTSLEMLDLGENRFSGLIPKWVGRRLSSLGILRLRSNNFRGSIPQELSYLKSLHVLDLAHNNLSGKIPASFGNFMDMDVKQRVNKNLFYGFVRGVYYQESLYVAISGAPREYNKLLYLVTSIDLSSNNLSGEIPELSRLSGLLVLDLSKNRLTGNIPDNIADLKELISLDVSENKLSGEIPSPISTMSFLSYLNLSNNNLSGRIPLGGQMQTFDPSSFTGNAALCGAPLPKSCSSEGPKFTPTNDEDGGDGDEAIWFYLSVATGFIVGFLGLFGSLLIRRSWTDSYVRFIDKILAWIYDTRAGQLCQKSKVKKRNPVRN
ncbi:receptor-like protein EIX2 [Aristolochia californica]|uniref:receptor-like protein EIX2 n=1 Tax=Aristolochia californica TaxID=171875 RepID=UPI0035DD0528